MVELVYRVLVGFEVPLEAFYLQGSRRKAVAVRHALSYRSEVSSLDYNLNLSLYKLLITI